MKNSVKTSFSSTFDFMLNTEQTCVLKHWLFRHAAAICPLQLLISKLEKNKTMKAEDKAKIMETLGALTKSITKLQEEIKGISSSSHPLQNAKSKAQVGLKPRWSHTLGVFPQPGCSTRHLPAMISPSQRVRVQSSYCGFFTGTEGAAGCRAGSVQENSGWRRHGNVEDQIHTTPDRGDRLAIVSQQNETNCSQNESFNDRVHSSVDVEVWWVSSSLCVCVCVCGFNQAAKRGLLVPGRGRGGLVRGRGSLRARGRGSRGRGRGVPRHAVVDHRPRALEISGFSEADGVDLLPHFAVSLDKKHKNSICSCILWILFYWSCVYILGIYSVHI